ncbi:hypothetical protein DYU05_14565 [Mucilaginibacter terrenus]|uniref:DUF4252 domain-containing protein n=1 Tax=Mucilaginibacter terrenus TaxID=2482727 RepID=A0A3E2NQT7_9SPHI|nr:hypothetical protein [Mucilaginibacter terrenus]RFZ83355.1 hypothetical protein DYU05_14565 [Mucilaginibacter terrenus]
MKKYLLILLLISSGAIARAQAISFYDLTNLANLSNGEAHNYLTLGKVFKHLYLEEKDGKKLERFRSVNPKQKEQTVTIGVNTVLSSGGVLRTVTYTTRDPQHIYNLIAQAKRNRMEMRFEGADADNNIYIFDNDFYHVAMYVSNKHGNGLIRVDQKEFVAY